MKLKANKQSLVEFAEHIAKTKHGARWAGHNFVYGIFQGQILYHVEHCETFSALPVAFSSRSELFGWASTNSQALSVVPGISPDHAIVTTGLRSGPQMLIDQPFVWVKATSNLYRKALLAWMSTHVPANTPSLHRDASDYCHSVAIALRQNIIRKKISDARRETIAKEFDQLSHAFNASSKSQLLAYANKDVMKLLDQSLDADHVINRQSLKLLPDAWVMIAPVLAGTNRSFGRMIERKAPPFPSSTVIVPLDAVTALKLHAASIPTCQSELLITFKKLQTRLLSSPKLTTEFNAASATLIGLINGTIKSFVR